MNNYKKWRSVCSERDKQTNNGPNKKKLIKVRKKREREKKRPGKLTRNAAVK